MVDFESGLQIELMPIEQNMSLQYEWSKDGKYIAVTKSFNDFDNSIHYSELHIINIENGDTTPILTGIDTSVRDVYWIDDDNFVVFGASVNGNDDIYRINMKNRALENLTQSLGDEFFPIPSPDGKLIAYSINVTGEKQIYILNLKNSSIFKLTSNPNGTISTYRWSRNSKYLAYNSEVDGIVQVFVIEVNTKESPPIQISHTEENAFVQNWIP